MILPHSCLYYNLCVILLSEEKTLNSVSIQCTLAVSLLFLHCISSLCFFIIIIRVSKAEFSSRWTGDVEISHDEK